MGVSFGIITLPIAFVIVVVPVVTLDNFCHCCCRDCPKSGVIPLEQFQLDEIDRAKDFVAGLRANRSLTYSNEVPIITRFTAEQKEWMTQMYSQYINQKALTSPINMINETLTSANNRTVTPATNEETATQLEGNVWLWNGRRRSRLRRDVIPLRVCPVDLIQEVLVTGYDADGNVIQVIKGQHVLRESCQREEWTV